MQCISPPPNCFGPAALQQSPWFLALTFIPLMCVFTQKMIISLSPDCYNTQRHSAIIIQTQCAAQHLLHCVE